MPFLQYRNGTTLTALTVEPNQIPIFLIPGITGNGQEVYKIAEEINKKRGGKTPVFIYSEVGDQTDESPDDSLLNLSQDQLAEKMLKEILDITNNARFDIQIAGFSSGAIIGSMLSKKLKESGHDAHLVAIDQPDMKSVTKYIAEDSDSLMTDLAKVVNMAAHLSGMQQVTFNEDQINGARNYWSLKDRLNFLGNILLRNQTVSDKQESTFSAYIARAVRNLNYPDVRQSPEINSIHTIFTKSTALKYGADPENWQEYDGGWGEHCNKDKLVTHHDEYLADKNHLDLLDGECANRVATIISDALRQDPRKLFTKQVAFLQQELEAQQKRQKVEDLPLNPAIKTVEATPGISRTPGTLFTQYKPNPGLATQKQVKSDKLDTNPVERSISSVSM